uniref:Uncharacterized protein LOC116947967 n=1 Tax=Petromyzon marinus TaxID=7757 RepID=A0AAJ7X3R4_PETMA
NPNANSFTCWPLVPAADGAAFNPRYHGDRCSRESKQPWLLWRRRACLLAWSPRGPAPRGARARAAPGGAGPRVVSPPPPAPSRRAHRKRRAPRTGRHAEALGMAGSRRLSALYTQYLLVTALYMLEPWERAAFNLLLVIIMAMVLYTTFIFMPQHVSAALGYLRSGELEL